MKLSALFRSRKTAAPVRMITTDLAAKEYARLCCLGMPWKGDDELNNCYKRGLVLFADMTQFDDYYRRQSLDTFSIVYLVPLIAEETLTRKTGG